MTICFKCGESYRTVYRGGEFLNLNTVDDREHWKTCAGRGPNRQRVRKLRKRKRQGSMFPQAQQHSAPAITGSLYRPSCGECSSPPWEACACSCVPIQISRVQIQNCTVADASSPAERLNEAADERLQLVLLDA